MLCIKPVTACSRSDTCFRACWVAARKPQNAPIPKMGSERCFLTFCPYFMLMNGSRGLMKVASGKETRPRRRSDQVRSSQVRWGKLGGLAFLFYARARAYTIILPDLKRRRRPGGRRRPRRASGGTNNERSEFRAAARAPGRACGATKQRAQRVPNAVRAAGRPSGGTNNDQREFPRRHGVVPYGPGR